jgi:hypothetical protein
LHDYEEQTAMTAENTALMAVWLMASRMGVQFCRHVHVLLFHSPHLKFSATSHCYLNYPANNFAAAATYAVLAEERRYVDDAV